jgi:peptide/nickel transport system substrate-binding protein
VENRRRAPTSRGFNGEEDDMDLSEKRTGQASGGQGLPRRELFRRAGQMAALGVVGVGLADFLAAPASASTTRFASGLAITPRKGGTLTTGGAGMDGLNPILSTTTTDEQQTSMLFDGLVSWDAHGNLIPMMATSLGSISPDGLKYTYTLRNGVKWSNGKPVTSKDFLLTYQMMYLPKYEAVTSGYRGNVSAYLKKVSAPDPQTVVFELKQPYSPWVANAAFIPALPAHVFEGMTAKQINNASFNSAPTVTSGEWMFSEWVKENYTIYLRNPNYYRQRTYLDKWVGKFTAPGQSSVSSLETSELDYVLITDLSQYLQLKSSRLLDSYLITDKGVTNYWYQMDPSKSAAGKIFSDKRVRQALVWGLDLDGMSKAIYGVLGNAGNSFFATVSWAYNPNVSPTYSFNAQMAGSILDGAGWTKNSSGIREKDGQLLKFTITTAANATEYVLAAQAMANDWNQLGCQVAVNPIQYTELLSIAFFSRQFDVIIPGFGFGVDPDLSATFHSRNITPGGENAGSYRSPTADSLMDEAVATSDQAKRKELYFKLGNVLAEDVPSVPMIRTKGALVYNKSVHGLSADTLGTFTCFQNSRFTNGLWVAS